MCRERKWNINVKKIITFTGKRWVLLLMSETIHHGIILKYSNNIFPF